MNSVEVGNNLVDYINEINPFNSKVKSIDLVRGAILIEQGAKDLQDKWTTDNGKKVAANLIKLYERMYEDQTNMNNAIKKISQTYMHHRLTKETNEVNYIP